MLQRSPTYIVSLPAEDPIANAPAPRAAGQGRLRDRALEERRCCTMAMLPAQPAPPGLVKKRPAQGRRARSCRPGYDVDTHFKPRYNPWDQRLCLVPDGDLFEAISAGRASVVTDQIDTFTENGIRLQSGAELEADMIVTATGLNLLVARRRAADRRRPRASTSRRRWPTRA